LSESHL